MFRLAEPRPSWMFHADLAKSVQFIQCQSKRLRETRHYYLRKAQGFHEVLLFWTNGTLNLINYVLLLTTAFHRKCKEEIAPIRGLHSWNCFDFPRRKLPRFTVVLHKGILSLPKKYCAKISLKPRQFADNVFFFATRDEERNVFSCGLNRFYCYTQFRIIVYLGQTKKWMKNIHIVKYTASSNNSCI